MDKRALAKIYYDLVKAGRRTEDSVPNVIRTEYDEIKAESTATATNA
ncbi:CD1375 family protein [Paenibacillus dakarensis]|nr:CD1375 family protein [Paenibacillus dakarensis]